MWVVQWLMERNLSLLSFTPTFLLFNWLLLASWILSLDEKGHFLNDYVKFTPWMHEQTVTEKDYQSKRWFLFQTFSYFTPLSVLLLIFLLCCICIVYAWLAMQERRCNIGVVGWLVTQIDNKIRWRLYQQNTYYKLAFWWWYTRRMAGGQYRKGYRKLFMAPRVFERASMLFCLR